MASKSVVFILHSFKIHVNYYPHRSSREGSHAERLQFLCESPMDTYQAVLDSDTSFLYFDSLSHFFGYLRRNSKRDIMEFDGRGYLSVHVHSSEGYYGLEAINLIQSCGINQQPVGINQQSALMQRCIQSYERQKGIIAKTLLKAFKVYMKSRNGVQMRKGQSSIKDKEEATLVQPSIIFSLIHTNDDTSNRQYHLSISSPIYELELPLQSLPLKVKVQRMSCQQLILGIRYKVAMPDQNITCQCLFRKHIMGALQVEEGHELEVCQYDKSFIIKNSTVNQGKSFNHPSINPTDNCILFLSLRHTPL